MTTYGVNMCMFCARTTDGRTCEAFPSGIPEALWSQRLDHRKPISGDSGVRFSFDSGRWAEEEEHYMMFWDDPPGVE